MGKVHDGIDERLAAFCESAPVFFVATAPAAVDGHVNVSPKGLDSFRVLGPHEAAYLDLTGSGAETLAHVRENGRITVMFCAFSGAPNIVRLHGRGEVVLAADARFPDLRGRFPQRPGVRAVIRIDVERVSDSCGFGVPLMELRGPRDTLDRWARRKGEEGVAAYQREHNARSIDGQPALPVPEGSR